MRPRVFPAEDAHQRVEILIPYPRFNEAAGIPRGRHDPRSHHPSSDPCFNEAAGIPRGRLIRQRVHRLGDNGFNEAAGIPRGRPPRRLRR